MVAAKINFSSGKELKFYDLASEFGNAFDSWYAAAIQWIELWTNQILAPDENRKIETLGSIWDLSAEPPLLCVPRTSSKSCDQAIFVGQATGASVSSDAVLVEIDRLG